MANRIKLTPIKKREFIRKIEEFGANITLAAKSCRISRVTLYEARAKDKAFKKAWETAVERGIDVLEDEAKRRAFRGVEEPVFYKGQICGTVQRYSDFLMGMMLKAHLKKYVERHEMSGPGGTPLQATTTSVIILPDNNRNPEQPAPENPRLSRIQEAIKSGGGNGNGNGSH
jgi:hypothetical protein